MLKNNEKEHCCCEHKKETENYKDEQEKHECCHHDEQVEHKEHECCHHHEEHKEHECCHHHEEEHECCHHEHNKKIGECGCCQKEEENIKTSILRLCLGIVVAFVGIYFETRLGNNILAKLLVILGYFILVYRTGKSALSMLIKEHAIDENFLVTISTFGAYLVGEHMEGLMVIILYEIGEILEDKAVDKSRSSIEELMDIRPEYANLKTGDSVEKVSPENVKIGDIVIIKDGEKIPLDGKVVKGEASLNVASLTGESALQKVTIGDEVLSGSINSSGLIEIEVTKEYKNSTVSRILDLVENATEKKAKAETFASSFARVYTPIVVVLAILVAIFLPVIATGITYKQSIYRALIFLVISCPCAIAISIPLSYFSGIGKASKEGI